MASTDDKRPVSAENIKKYLADYSMVKIDVLFDNMSLSNNESTINIDGADAYDYIIVETSYDNGNSRAVHADVIWPEMVKSVWRNSSYYYAASSADLVRLMFSFNGSRLSLNQNPVGAKAHVTRVTGIRIWGGGISAIH